MAHMDDKQYYGHRFLVYLWSKIRQNRPQNDNQSSPCRLLSWDLRFARLWR